MQLGFRIVRAGLLLAVAFSQENAIAQTFAWSKLDGPYVGNVIDMVGDSRGDVFVLTNSEGVFRSTDEGSHWQETNTGLDYRNVTFLAVDTTSTVYAGGIFAGLFKTTDRGLSWSRMGFTGRPVAAGVLSGGRLWIAGQDSVFISSDGGESWYSSRVSNFMGSAEAGRGSDILANVGGVAEDRDGNLYAGLIATSPPNALPYGGGLYVSSDSGRSWRQWGLFWESIEAIAVNKGNTVFVSNGFNVFSAPENDSLFATNSIGLPHSIIGVLSTNSSGEVFATVGGGVYVCDDDGRSWVPVVARGLSSATIAAIIYNPAGVSFAGTNSHGVFRMEAGEGAWYQCGLFQAAATSVGIDQVGDLYIATNDRIYKPGSEIGTWIMSSNGLPSTAVYEITTLGLTGKIYAATRNGLFRSTDAGATWAMTMGGCTFDVKKSPSGTLYAGTFVGVTRSTDGGTTWTPPSNVGLPSLAVQNVLPISDWNVLAGTEYNGIFTTTDGGDFWSQTGISSQFMFCTIEDIAEDGLGTVYAGTDSAGAFYTTDGGTDWTKIQGITASDVTCLLMRQGHPFFAGTLDGGVFVSTDGGQAWRSMNDGLTDSSVASIAMDQHGYLYAATDSGVYSTMGPVTAVSMPEARQVAYSMSQNYPNPFNPTTTISYQLSAVSRVTLKVYDVLGREIATVVDGKEQEGYHTVQFDGSRLASGVYFYKLEVIPQSDNGSVGQRSFVETKKMILMK